MRNLSYYLRSQKNKDFQPEPFLTLLELEKTGWYRLRYYQKTVGFHEEATLSGAAGTARILFVEEEDATTGDLIIQQLTGTGNWNAGAAITDDYGGSAKVFETMRTADSTGITFRLAQYPEDVIYDGYTYLAFPCKIGEITYGKGQFQAVQMTIGNPNRLAEAWVRKARGFIGEKARMRLVWAGDLT